MLFNTLNRNITVSVFFFEHINKIRFFLLVIEESRLAIKIKKSNSTLSHLSRLLRQGEPAVIGKVTDNQLCLDFRTIDVSDEAALLAALQSADRQLSKI
jgi:seryl-tRNA(Sec) selenium transferase